MASKRVPTSQYSNRPKTGKRPYQQPQWSLGWDQNQKDSFKQNTSFMKYHNESSFVLQDKSVSNEQNKKADLRKQKTEQFNSKLPTFDPKNANKSHIVFGDEKGDFSKKPSGITSPRVPPGGRSQIVFG